MLAGGTRGDSMGPSGLVEGNADALNAKGLECNRRGDTRGALFLETHQPQ